MIDKIFGFDGRKNRLLTVNSTVCIFYQRYENDEVQLVATRSDNGRDWTEFKSFTLKYEPSGMWSFVFDQRRVGLAVQYNNLTLEWYVLSSNGELRKMKSRQRLYLELRQLRFYLQDNKLNIARIIYDHDTKEAPLLITRSSDLYDDFMKEER